jgi:ferric-dicitrate binding protein FerR (iron transport regulator)
VVAFPKEAVKRLPATTIDASWVRFRLRNGYGAALAVVKSDWNRVWSMAQGLGDRKTFAAFETSTRRVAIKDAHSMELMARSRSRVEPQVDPITFVAPSPYHMLLANEQSPSLELMVG